MPETDVSWFAVGNLTVFTVIPLKTVSTQTKHVFPRGQGCDGGAPIKADPTYISKDALQGQHSLLFMFRAVMNVEFLT